MYSGGSPSSSVVLSKSSEKLREEENDMDYGLMWCWGFSEQGQLGPDQPPSSPPTICRWFQGRKLAAVAAGGLFTLVLTEDNVLYGMGSNSLNQLGSRKSSSHVPSIVPCLEEKTIVKIACGQQHSALVTDKGRVITFGFDDRNQLGREGAPHVPTKIRDPEFLLHKVIDVKCGNSHTVALTDDGLVYSWGRGEEGQLGYGEGYDYSSPRVVVGVKNIVQIACGSLFTLALDKDGRIFSWGCNTDGQLGLNHLGDTFQPTEIKILNGKNIVKIAAGWKQSFFMSKSGEVWCCGRNDMGQLGLGFTSTIEKTPKVVRGLAAEKIIQVSSGWTHTIFLNELGEIYSCGGGKRMQVGIDLNDVESYNSLSLSLNTSVPVILTPTLVLSGRRITQVICGGEHCLALASNPQNMTLSSDFRKILNEEILADIVFSVEGRKIYAHKTILYARSSVFTKLISELKDGLMEVVIEAVKYEAYYLLLVFVYADWIEFGDFRENESSTLQQLAMDIYDLSVEYNFPRLSALCIRTIEKKFNKLPLPTLASDLKKLISSNIGDLADVIFIAEGQSFEKTKEGNLLYAHKIIFHARVPELCNYLHMNHTEKEDTHDIIVVEDCKFQAFLGLLSYIYTDDRHDIRKDLVLDLIPACRNYHLPILIQRLSNIVKTQILTTMNVSIILSLARKYEFSHLLHYCHYFILQYWEEMQEGDLLQFISEQDLKDIEILRNIEIPVEEHENSSDGESFFSSGGGSFIEDAKSRISSFFTHIKSNAQQLPLANASTPSTANDSEATPNNTVE